MDIFLYLMAIYSACMALVALSGRTTRPIYGMEPGYHFLNKLSKEDPYRKLHMVTQFITNLLVSFGCLGVGLYLSHVISLPKPTVTIIVICNFIIFLLISLVFAFLAKPRNQSKSKRKNTTKEFIMLGDIIIIYGATTPQVFENSSYRMDYDSFVQDTELPFMTCKLHLADGEHYIGDIIFDSQDHPITSDELRYLPITQIHFDE